MPATGTPVLHRDDDLTRRTAEGRRWTLLRLGAGMTQKQAAALVGCHPVTLGNVERGAQRAGPGLAMRLDALYAQDAS